MFFIGVCGSSASGKTTISKMIQQEYLEKYNLKSIIISLDMFYKETKDYPKNLKKYKELCMSKENISKPIEEREIFNFDNPELLDMVKARNVLINISKGIKKVIIPIYNFGKFPNTTEILEIEPDISIIIVEGIFLFYELDKHLKNIFDFLVFVEVRDEFSNKQYNKGTMIHFLSNYKQDEIQIFLRRFYRDKLYRKDSFEFIEFLYIWENIMKYIVNIYILIKN